LIRRDVPQEVVRVPLDHESTEMAELARTLTGFGHGGFLGREGRVDAPAGDEVLDEQSAQATKQAVS
jgi:hypothetical protein